MSSASGFREGKPLLVNNQFTSSVWYLWYRFSLDIMWIIIPQIFSPARDWSKHVTWAEIPQLNLGNIQEYSPIFKTARVAKKIWRVINTIASIWRENMFGYLSLDIICSSQFSLSYALGKLFVTRNRQCPRTNILAYFRAKWRPLFIYTICRNSFDFWQEKVTYFLCPKRFAYPEFVV